MTDNQSLSRWELRVALAATGDHDHGGDFSLAIARLNKKRIRIAIQKGRDIAGITVDAFLQREREAWEALKKRAVSGEVVLFGVAYWPTLPGKIAGKDSDEDNDSAESTNDEDDDAKNSGVESGSDRKPGKFRIFDDMAEEEDEQEEVVEVIGPEDVVDLVLDQPEDKLRLRPRDWMHADASWWRDIEVEYRQSHSVPAEASNYQTSGKPNELAKVIRKVFPDGPPKGFGASKVLESAEHCNLSAKDYALMQKAKPKTFSRAIHQSRSRRVGDENPEDNPPR